MYKKTYEWEKNMYFFYKNTSKFPGESFLKIVQEHIRFSMSKKYYKNRSKESFHKIVFLQKIIHQEQIFCKIASSDAFEIQ